jgi:hypothetical protein
MAMSMGNSNYGEAVRGWNHDNRLCVDTYSGSNPIATSLHGVCLRVAGHLPQSGERLMPYILR